jgi:hypothetical protein
MVDFFGHTLPCFHPNPKINHGLGANMVNMMENEGQSFVHTKGTIQTML